MSLQIQYSKKIAKELGKVAVYFPGEEIKVGDIVQFPHGIGLFKTAPYGSFQKITDLNSLGVNYDIVTDSGALDSYQFKSEKSVNSKFATNGNLDLGTDQLPSGNAKLKLSFSKKGSIYFYALDCKKQYINDLLSIEKEVNSNDKELLWEDTFLITSLTIAKKALVIQSVSKNSEITIGVDVQNAQSNNLKLDVDTKVTIEKQKGDLFIKDWSDDVTVFVDVKRFKRKKFSKEKSLKSGLLLDDETKFKICLEPVDLSVYINEKNKK